MSTTQQHSSDAPHSDSTTITPTGVAADHTAQLNEEVAATRVFSKSILISAVRCVLTYVIFPWVMPLVGRAGDTGPVIGSIIGVVAIGFNIASIRRFWISNHKWKWPITVLNGGVIVLLLILLSQDIGSF